MESVMIPLDRILISSLLLCSAGAVHAADGQKIFSQGGQNPAAMACLGCHGADGKGMAAAGFPRLAGLPAAYLSKQLHDFRDGSRKNPIMEPLAKALSDEEIQAVTATLAAMPAEPVADTRRQQMATDATEKLGPTWPSDKPTQKLDYILLSGKGRWHVSTAAVVEETIASDHRPVIAELMLK